MLTAKEHTEDAGFDAGLSRGNTVELEEIGRRQPVMQRLREIWRRRELLFNLTKREVKVRHKNSILGVAWNLLNPLLNLVIFTFVFTQILQNRVPRYALKLLSGLTIYHLFSFGVMSATSSIIGGANLVKKNWFPREILPMASVLSNLVTFASRLTILCIGLILFQQSPEWSMIWLIPLAVLIALVMAIGVGLMLAALNVFFRDVQHFLELALLALFWLTPIVFQYDMIARVLNDDGPLESLGGERLAMINPMTSLVTTFHRVLYNPSNLSEAEQGQYFFELMKHPTEWYAQNLMISGAVAIVFLVIGMKVFSRLEGGFAERL